MKKQNVKKARAVLFMFSVAVILLFGIVPYTVAWLEDSKSVVNVFGKGNVTIEINENFNGAEKSNVTVKNTGNIPGFIRVVLVPVWRDAEGNNSGLETDGTYTMTLRAGSGVTEWTETDGYYYFNNAVPAGAFTDILVSSCTVTVDLTEYPEYGGMTFEMQVIASAIQAEGWTASADTAQEAFAAAASGL